MKKNKGIVLILVLAIMLTSFSTVFAAEPTTNNKVNALIEAGLVQGDASGYRLDDTITRAEVITMLVRLQGKEDLAATMKSMPGPFSDVAPTHWANGNINYAAAMGITNGYPDGTFKPEAEIKNSEVIALLVRLTGEMSEEEVANAVWPISYMIKASELNILDGVTIGYDDLAVREKAFEMVYNTKEIKPVIETVGNPVEALVIENERIGRLDKSEVAVKVLADQYTREEGLEAGEEFTVDLADVYFEDALDGEALLGKVLKVYFDAKGEPVKVSVDGGYDYIQGKITDILSDEVEIDEEAFDVSIDADEREDKVLSLAIYNNEDVSYDGASGFRNSVNEAEFVRATVNNGNVIFIEAFDFDDIAPVSEVDDETIYFIDNNRGGAERTLITRGKDLVVINYDGEFSQGEAADVEEEDIIHWFTDDDDNIVIVVMDAEDAMVEGVFEGISFDRRSDDEPTIELDDKEVKALIDNGSFSPVYSTLADKDKHYVLTSDYIAELEGFYDEEAVAYVDMFGNLQKLVGAEEVDTRFIAVITDVFYREFELALGTGEVDFFDVTRDTEFYKTVGDELVEATLDDFDEYDLVEVLADGSEIVEVEKLTDSENVITNMTKNVVDFDGEYFYIDENTTVFVLDMEEVDKSEVMDVKDFLDIVDEEETMKGYVVVDSRDQDVADHIIITEYTKERATETFEEVVEVIRIRAEGSDYLLTVEDASGNREVYLVEDDAEVLKIKNNEVKVEDIVELKLDEETEEFVSMTVLLNDGSDVYYIDAIGRGGSRNLNYVVLEDVNGSTKTVWIASTADVFGSYDEGSFVAVGEIDAYDTIGLIKVVADDSEITGVWATADEVAVAEFVAMLDALPALADLVLADKADVEDVRAYFDGMTADQKAMVTVGDLDALVAYEDKLVVLEAEAVDAAAIQEFVDAVALIPATVTADDIVVVEDARAIYDGLTSAQAGMVQMADYLKLTDAEAAVVVIEADMAAAQAFVDELHALPALADLVVEDKPEVEAARATFDALTVDEAAYVDQADIDLLGDYEAKIAELEA